MFEGGENVNNLLKSTFNLVGFFAAWSVLGTTSASAHVSEQGFVLLLPTDIYVAAGCLAVVVSIIVVSLLPHAWARSIFRTTKIQDTGISSETTVSGAEVILSIASLVLLSVLILIGVIGTRDPLANLLPLTIWTVWWIPFVMLHCLLGNLWKWSNPWMGLHVLVFGRLDQEPLIRLPAWLGVWPALLGFLSFVAFAIAYPAPTDPAILANVVLGYVLSTFVGMVVFGGEQWLSRGECFTLFFRFASNLAPFQPRETGQQLVIGLPGWKAMELPQLPVSLALFVLTLLASGSFDGLNETFWWLAQIGVNPLEFPGRSAVITPSIVGLIGANILLAGIFALSVWSGVVLAGVPDLEGYPVSFKTAFCRLVLSVLPIAFVYHGSHYLISFLVNGQYVIAALSDPLANGSNYLGLENYQVTTGFLNSRDSVEQIWFSQAALIVTGHILAVLMAHCTIARLYNSRRQAFLCHIPIGVFMAAYTWFGLWLLAAPRGA